MKALSYLFLGVLIAGGNQGQAQLMVEDSGLAATIRMFGAPVLSANPDLLNSTSNNVGPWGSPDFLYSFANDVGPLGSPDMLNSVTNEYGTGLKIRLLDVPLELDAP